MPALCLAGASVLYSAAFAALDPSIPAPAFLRRLFKRYCCWLLAVLCSFVTDVKPASGGGASGCEAGPALKLAWHEIVRGGLIL